jgi:hypothetical protein
MSNSTKEGYVPGTLSVLCRWQDASGAWVEGNRQFDVFQSRLEDLDISDSPPVLWPGTPEPIEKRKGELLVEGSCQHIVDDGLY